ncbi:MAG TPA: CpsD/CapB family tyrosine-protein kinase [Steroidobacteraceae bacterium]|nr:CpsD/CapB family tyrosine-protein kinase [Steroidobacteraceae bacterium]
MTIIESALERAKALKTGRPAMHSPAAPAAVHRPSRRINDGPAPAVLFQPQRVTLDTRTARENRLLLSSSVQEDRPAIAAYGMLRTRLLHRARAKGWTTIGITSPAPQDGKSLTALNLAFSLAREQNSTVALIDLDMRNPSTCRCLGIEPPVELRDFFEQKGPSPQDLFMSVGVDNLILAGNITATNLASELLASTRLEELLEFVKKSITSPLILVDLPPLLSPDDALVVAPRIDALLLVASEGVTPISELQRAVQLMSEFPIAGLVFNRSSETGAQYAYGYGYGSD